MKTVLGVVSALFATALLTLFIMADNAAAQQSKKFTSVQLNSLSRPQVEGAVRFQTLTIVGKGNPTLRLCRKGCPQKMLPVTGRQLPALVPGGWYDFKSIQWKGKYWVVGGQRADPVPTVTPTGAPVVMPTAAPTVTPTATPTTTPTVVPTPTPTATRTARPTVMPTAVPSATSTPSNPLAFDFSATGHGMESVAVVLKADPGASGATVTCQVTGVPSDVSLQPIRECQYLLVPSGRGHRGADVEFSYTVTRIADGKTSAPAKIRVGWNQDGNFIGDHFSLAPYRDNLTREEAYYLIRTTNFGDRMSELVELAMQPGGLDKVVDRILTVEDTDQCRTIEQAAQSFADRDRTPICNNITLTGPSGTGVLVPFCAPGSAANSLITANAVALRWVFALRYGCNPFRERIALLWHNHFATNLYDTGINGGTSTRSHYIEQHAATLRALERPKGFMPIDQIVARMHGADGAMGVWLDNRRNERFGGGNENYARELLELFSLGVRDIVRGSTNYNESDIYDFRQALMGYSDETAADTVTKRTLMGTCDAKCTSDACKACALLPVDGASGQTREIVEKVTNPHFYNSRWNFPTQPGQVVLFDGTPWAKRAAFKADVFSAGGDTLTPYLMNSHPGVSRFFAARLLTTFVTLEPSDEMVSSVADALVKSSWDPVPALRMLLRSSAFFAKENRYDGFNNPIEHLITFMRALGLPADRAMTVQEQVCPNNPAQTCFLDITQRVLTWINLGGYPLLRMPSVFGLPEIGKITGNHIHNGSVFFTVQRFLDRLRAVPDILNYVSVNIKSKKTSFAWQELLPSAEKQRSPDAVLDHISARLGLSITDQQRPLLIEYLSNVTPRTVTKDGIVDADPTYKRSVDWQSLTADQFNALMELKIPGLLTILAALPQSQFR